MWSDDLYWHPYFFKGQKFKAYFLYEGHDKILEHKITTVDSLNLTMMKGDDKSMIKKKVFTLVNIHDGDKILLGLKKRGFATGKWNGFGGKVQNDATILDGAIREVKEECSLELIRDDVKHMGIIDFEFKDDPVHLEVHVFEAKKYSGVVTESEEMLPQWFKITEMPYDKMWNDDLYWHPYFFKGQKFKAHFLYEGFDKILEHTIIPVEQLDNFK
jgi:8-oxo-dGTP diphosphatase/2-hydroxy-dATP diphosphatase